MPEQRDNPKEPLILRCLKAMAGIDWKALALVLAAIGGFGGAIWNKIDSIIDRALAARTQQGVYEALAQRMDEMSVRVNALEVAHAPKPPLPARIPTKAEPPPPEVSPATAEAAPAPPVQFKSARLPSFQAIQQRALANDLPVALDAAPPR
jgi:hypothetical protein